MICDSALNKKFKSAAVISFIFIEGHQAVDDLRRLWNFFVNVDIHSTQKKW